jgi:hypothetical protein
MVFYLVGVSLYGFKPAPSESGWREGGHAGLSRVNLLGEIASEKSHLVDEGRFGLCVEDAQPLIWGDE